MSVDIRLRGYFANTTLFHQTGEQVWLQLLDIIAMTDPGPAGRASQRFVAKHSEEGIALDTS